MTICHNAIGSPSLPLSQLIFSNHPAPTMRCTRFNDIIETDWMRENVLFLVSKLWLSKFLTHHSCPTHTAESNGKFWHLVIGPNFGVLHILLDAEIPKMLLLQRVRIEPDTVCLYSWHRCTLSAPSLNLLLRVLTKPVCTIIIRVVISEYPFEMRSYLYFYRNQHEFGGGTRP